MGETARAPANRKADSRHFGKTRRLSHLSYEGIPGIRSRLPFHVRSRICNCQTDTSDTDATGRVAVASRRRDRRVERAKAKNRPKAERPRAETGGRSPCRRNKHVCSYQTPLAGNYRFMVVIEGSFESDGYPSSIGRSCRREARSRQRKPSTVPAGSGVRGCFRRRIPELRLRSSNGLRRANPLAEQFVVRSLPVVRRAGSIVPIARTIICLNVVGSLERRYRQTDKGPPRLPTPTPRGNSNGYAMIS